MDRESDIRTGTPEKYLLYSGYGDFQVQNYAGIHLSKMIQIPCLWCPSSDTKIVGENKNRNYLVLYKPLSLE